MGIISEVLYLIVFVICPIFISLIVIKNTKRCNILIQGTYAGYSPYVYKNITLCYPIFKYNYTYYKYGFRNKRLTYFQMSTQNHISIISHKKYS